MANGEINPETFDNGEPIWSIAGYQDDSGNFHDFTHMDAESIDREFESNFFPEVDYVIIEWFDAEDRSLQHATLVGPFDDYEDLGDSVETYFEEGS